MREYGQIQCGYWQRACEEGWSNDAMLLGAYLLTGPHSNGIGCYRLPVGYVSDDLGWERKRVDETINELFGNGFCNRFGTVVLIPKFLRWNAIRNPNIAKSREDEFHAIPNDDAKKAAARALLEFGNHWSNDFVNHLETVTLTNPKQNPTQPNPESKQDANASLSAKDADGPPPCPHQEIIELYHETLPELPRIVVSRWPGSKSEPHLRARWRENAEHQTLDFWRTFFQVVRTNSHWMGQNDRNWTADLHWLIERRNFDKVVQRWANQAEAA